MQEYVITVILGLSTIVTITLLLLPTQYGSSEADLSKRTDAASPSVQILVLGDIGRSPRMQYHALSVAKHGGSVQLIGYLDNEPLPQLKTYGVKIIPLPQPPKWLQTSNKLLFLALAPVKVLLQLWTLWMVLGYQTTPSKWLLVQNPPSIPTLFIATTTCFLRHTRLVIDWHNFGYSILALKLGEQHPVVKISKLYEKVLARAAYSHFTVTDAMNGVVRKEFISTAPVLTLHDRPADIFQPSTTNERIVCLQKLLPEQADSIIDQRTRLVVSSTSWTPDEDFSVLLRALCEYSTVASRTSTKLPKLLVVITGKGPQKPYYIQQIEKLKQAGSLDMVTITTRWLNFADYASLLASADLGVSLHTSSSGVDLPMKVVDMFGAGLPVLGFDNFKAWPELVTEGVNGRGFSSAEQMADILQEVFDPAEKQLQRLREGAIKESRRRWDAEWDPIAGKLFGLT